jgi:hypothetical protein
MGIRIGVGCGSGIGDGICMRIGIVGIICIISQIVSQRVARGKHLFAYSTNKELAAPTKGALARKSYTGGRILHVSQLVTVYSCKVKQQDNSKTTQVVLLTTNKHPPKHSHPTPPKRPPKQNHPTTTKSTATPETNQRPPKAKPPDTKSTATPKPPNAPKSKTTRAA